MVFFGGYNITTLCAKKMKPNVGCCCLQAYCLNVGKFCYKDNKNVKRINEVCLETRGTCGNTL